ncbi:Translation initiation factor 3 [Venturia nashicola]|uniref:Translation initiation factor 3 n=1 Tax=Venturia nashicola TaxID=86259 RepID=A0A4Z1P7X7_9PEZI|nr:Translation initiation factor 3 [Venturia nashicola]TLD27813.1 Translation initiation factor 3 [Venturia nashicola]
MSHCQSLRIALYRVFVRPALLNPIIPCLLPSSAYQTRSNTTAQWPPVEPSQHDSAATSVEPKKRSYKDRLAEKKAARSPFASERHAITQAPKIKGAPPRLPRDLEIRSRYIDFVDREGGFNPDVLRDDVLKMLDPLTEHLVQVDVPDPDDPRAVPKCKIFTKEHLRERERVKKEIEKERLKVERSSKIVELNWAIATGDLELKLNQVGSFLEEGRKVDIMIAPKRRKRAATKDEIEELVNKIWEKLESVGGVTQAAPAEGEKGGTMTFFFQKKKKS